MLLNFLDTCYYLRLIINYKILYKFKRNLYYINLVCDSNIVIKILFKWLQYQRIKLNLFKKVKN